MRRGDPATRFGRPIRTDKQNRLIYHLLEPRRFECEMLCPNIGVHLSKGTAGNKWGNERQAIPDWLVKVRRSEEVKLFAGPLDFPCIARSLAVKGGAENPELSQSDGRCTCCECLTSWHLQCHEKFACRLGGVQPPGICEHERG
eukprot:5381623-Pyramimonas_sp.AAC.1